MEQISSGSALVTSDYLSFLLKYRVLDYNHQKIQVIRERHASQRCSKFPLLPSPLLAGDFPISSDPEKSNLTSFFGEIKMKEDCPFWMQSFPGGIAHELFPINMGNIFLKKFFTTRYA